ncbi:hypothetical protein B0J12DRAFT_670774 [Macrophomina phaseolina]|uniref:Uncharacterized protein n=1 Tax=Macrophomina phaseolina TaxID=35725 RepID=A0ABQ8G7H1_9PEZI|nr:hypothetical protein B0J12DRAFT_670774 [Macrophomina phaseolina]
MRSLRVPMVALSAASEGWSFSRPLAAAAARDAGQKQGWGVSIGVRRLPTPPYPCCRRHHSSVVRTNQNSTRSSPRPKEYRALPNPRADDRRPPRQHYPRANGPTLGQMMQGIGREGPRHEQGEDGGDALAVVVDCRYARAGERCSPPRCREAPVLRD